MGILEIFQKRHSVRKFMPQALSDEAIESLIQAASLAPSARNVQPWEFIVIKDNSKRKKIADFAKNNGAFIRDAPVCIAVFCHDTKYYLEDGCAATTQLLLAASSLGIGACWVAGDKKDYCHDIKQFLKVPQGLKLVSLIALGYAQEESAAEKKNFKSLIHREVF